MASLGNDLALIRKEQNLTLDEINEATKIPIRILRSIEDDSIFTDFQENATYIRSYVRSYAKALSIEDEKIIYALDQKQADVYKGALKTFWENEEAWPPDDKDLDQVDQPTEDRVQDIKKDQTPKANDSPKGAHEETKPETTSKEADIHSVDWADLGRELKPLKTPRSNAIIGIIAFVIIAVAGLMFYFLQDGENNSGKSQSNTPKQASTPTVTTDSLELNIVSSVKDDTPAVAEDTSSADLPSKQLESLPDTLDIVVYAAYGKLEPVRVYTDIMDNINPYWIEEGGAIRFDFVNELRIRGQFNRIVLLMNGHVVQNIREQFYNPETRLVEINRSFFEEDPKWLQPAPDSLAIDAPPPSIIKERPTFN